jgi:hypothetical protein
MCRDEFRRAYRMIREFGPSIIHLQLCDGCRHRLELAYQCNETRKTPQLYLGAYSPDLAIRLREAGLKVRIIWGLGRLWIAAEAHHASEAKPKTAVSLPYAL